MKESSLISVVLPVYNAEDTLKEAIDSILCQTHTRIELIIINDGSTDNSERIIENYNDHRIRFYTNETNKGLIYTLNRALSLCNGDYIARMDADDISLPHRLETQLQYLKRHPDIDVVGSARLIFGEKNSPRKQSFPSTCEDVRAYMFLASPVVHPSVLMKKATLLIHNIQYDDHYPCMEDYKLWNDILKVGGIANISEPLLYYRISYGQISMRYKHEQLERNKSFRRKLIFDFLKQKGISVKSEQIDEKILKQISRTKAMTIVDSKCFSAILFVFYLSLQLNPVKVLFYFLSSCVWLRKEFNYKYIGAIILHCLRVKSFSFLAV